MVPRSYGGWHSRDCAHPALGLSKDLRCELVFLSPSDQRVGVDGGQHSVAFNSPRQISRDLGKSYVLSRNGAGSHRAYLCA